MWDCLCECGNEVIVEDSHLKTNHSQTCGCPKNKKGVDNPNYQGYKEISLAMWNRIQSNAKIRNHIFDITIEYVWNVFIKQKRLCALSNIDIYFATTSKNFNNGIATASLDRIDNSKGYIKGNVQWVHKDINRMKWAHDEEYFIELCKEVAKCKR